MAIQSRRDQVLAYRFLLRRRHAALLASDPDSAEAPLRKLGTATFAGIMAATLMAAGAGVLGVLSPGHDTSWKTSGAIIIEKETGSRYYYDAAHDPPVLHHVLNYTSARLLLAQTGWQTVSVSAKSLAGTPRGDDIGIVGAPDELPGPSGVLGQPWTACSIPASGASDRPLTEVGIGTGIPALPTTTAVPASQGLLVQAPDQTYWLVWNGHRLQIGSDQATVATHPYDSPRNVMQALDFDIGSATRVSLAWLNTLPTWSPLVVPEVGSGPTTLTQQGKTGVPAGRLVKLPGISGVTTDRWYVATSRGYELVDTIERALLLATPVNTDAQTNETLISTQDLQSVSQSTDGLNSAGQWPTSLPTLVNGAVSGPIASCSTTAGGNSTAAVSFAALAAGQTQTTGGSPVPVDQQRFVADTVTMPPGDVALVQTPPSPGTAIGTVYLVTGNGAYTTRDLLSGAPSDIAATLKALGYPSLTPTVIPAQYVDLLDDGPTLNPSAAQTVVRPPAPATEPVISTGN